MPSHSSSSHPESSHPYCDTRSQSTTSLETISKRSWVSWLIPKIRREGLLPLPEGARLSSNPPELPAMPCMSLELPHPARTPDSLPVLGDSTWGETLDPSPLPPITILGWQAPYSTTRSWYHFCRFLGQHRHSLQCLLPFPSSKLTRSPNPTPSRIRQGMGPDQTTWAAHTQACTNQGTHRQYFCPHLPHTAKQLAKCQITHQISTPSPSSFPLAAAHRSNHFRAATRRTRANRGHTRRLANGVIQRLQHSR